MGEHESTVLYLRAWAAAVHGGRGQPVGQAGDRWIPALRDGAAGDAVGQQQGLTLILFPGGNAQGFTEFTECMPSIPRRQGDGSPLRECHQRQQFHTGQHTC